MPTIEAKVEPKPFPFEVGQTVTVYRNPKDRTPPQMEGGWTVIFISNSKDSVMVQKKREGGNADLKEVPPEILKKWTDGMTEGTELNFQGGKFFAMSVRQGRAEMVQMEGTNIDTEKVSRYSRKVLPILDIMKDNEWTAVM